MILKIEKFIVFPPNEIYGYFINELKLNYILAKAFQAKAKAKTTRQNRNRKQ